VRRLYQNESEAPRLRDEMEEIKHCSALEEVGAFVSLLPEFCKFIKEGRHNETNSVIIP